MAKNSNGAGSRIIPALRYQDAPGAIEWLCEAFGFTKHLVVPGEEDGTIAHAELVIGTAMVMLGSANSHGGNAFDQRVRPVPELNGLNSQSVYMIVDDADAHHARAIAAGAEVLMELEDRHYGGRDYSCLDLEGNAWSFGTFDPWQG